MALEIYNILMRSRSVVTVALSDTPESLEHPMRREVLERLCKDITLILEKMEDAA